MTGALTMLAKRRVLAIRSHAWIRAPSLRDNELHICSASRPGIPDSAARSREDVPAVTAEREEMN